MSTPPGQYIPSPEDYLYDDEDMDTIPPAHSKHDVSFADTFTPGSVHHHGGDPTPVPIHPSIPPSMQSLYSAESIPTLFSPLLETDSEVNSLQSSLNTLIQLKGQWQGIIDSILLRMSTAKPAKLPVPPAQASNPSKPVDNAPVSKNRSILTPAIKQSISAALSLQSTIPTLPASLHRDGEGISTLDTLTPIPSRQSIQSRGDRIAKTLHALIQGTMHRLKDRKHALQPTLREEFQTIVKSIQANGEWVGKGKGKREEEMGDKV